MLNKQDLKPYLDDLDSLMANHDQPERNTVAARLDAVAEAYELNPHSIGWGLWQAVKERLEQ